MPYEGQNPIQRKKERGNIKFLCCTFEDWFTATKSEVLGQ